MNPSIKKKIQKLRKDPILFVRDMLFKHGVEAKYLSPISYPAQHKFTVVSAVYNVGKYLEEYFTTIVNQSISFEKYIFLVLVDDGSTDDSAEIIKKWQKQYPNNITYVYKENGGQASARNVGIHYIHTDWCTFMDPDDFLDKNYFREVDRTLVNHPNVGMVSCNFIYYYEDKNMFKNNHPQNYRFKDKIKIFDVTDENQHIQLSVNSSFVKTEIVKRNELKFDSRVKPSFEDATFMLEYSLVQHEVEHSQVAFIKDAKYFYRKRSDGTSALDTAWTKPSGYDEVLRYGCLHALQSFKMSLGYVPKFVQTTVLYYHVWQIHRIVNDDSALSFLSNEQKSEYLKLLREIFKHIEDDVIDSFGLASVWLYQKSGMLNLYKKKALSEELQVCYFDKYDKYKNEGWFYYFAPKNSEIEFTIDGETITPTDTKIVKHTFLDEDFIFEYRFWIPLGSNESFLTVKIDGHEVQIGANGNRYRDGVAVKHLKMPQKVNSQYQNRGDHWIVMDRNVQADDNAEHFYRYLKQTHPEIEAYFALNKDSHDWERLHGEGFKMLDFGSRSFENLLKSCSVIVSSHADDYIVDYFGDGGLVGKDFVFLPHGIFQNDLHKWMNSKSKIMSLLITTTDKEHQSIAGNYNHYIYGNKVTKQIGFPRHDSLLSGNKTDNKRLLIMPTWRKDLVGKFDSMSGEWIKSDKFADSVYAQAWRSMLNSGSIKRIALESGYEIIFAPHKNVEQYIQDFDVPSYVTTWTTNSGVGIQHLFQTTDLMITDYSSVAFEMGFLNKPVIYYQFDFDDFHRSQWQRGYFNYESDGFGPVVSNEKMLLDNVEAIIKNNCAPDAVYAERMQKTFKYKDGKNSERVYNEIQEMMRLEPSH